MVIALNVKFELKPERVDEFLRIMQEDAEQTLTVEPGALQFIIGRRYDDGGNGHNSNVFHLHEQYKSKADLDYHNATPHFKKFAAFLDTDDPLASPAVVNEYECSHTPVVVPSRSSLSSSSPIFCLNVESCIKPEFHDEFVQVMADHQANSQAEPGCLQFDWGASTTTPNSFYIHEEYQDKAAYDAHERTPHFEKFGVFNKKDPYAKPQVVDYYQML